MTGELENRILPVPVSSVTAAARLALDGVAKNVATLVPKPLTPVLIGRPVALVNTAYEAVPMLGVIRTGLSENTKEPEPVSSETRVLISADVVEANWANELAVVAKPVAAPV